MFRQTKAALVAVTVIGVLFTGMSVAAAPPHELQHVPQQAKSHNSAKSNAASLAIPDPAMPEPAQAAAGYNSAKSNAASLAVPVPDPTTPEPAQAATGYNSAKSNAASLAVPESDPGVTILEIGIQEEGVNLEISVNEEGLPSDQTRSGRNPQTGSKDVSRPARNNLGGGSFGASGIGTRLSGASPSVAHVPAT